MSTGDRTPLLIAIGVIAAVLIVVLAIVIRQSGNDENGYPEEVRNQFLDACNAQSGATPDRCQCILDEIEANVDLDEFVAKDQELGENPQADRPQWLIDATETCSA